MPASLPLPSTGIPADTLAAIRRTFLEECEAHLTALEQGLDASTQDQHDAERLEAAVRAAHSIRGGAGLFDMAEVVRVAQLLECALARGRDTPTWLTPAVCQRLETTVEGLAELIQASRDGMQSDASRADRLEAELSALLPDAPAVAHDTSPDFAPRPVDLEGLGLRPEDEADA